MRFLTTCVVAALIATSAFADDMEERRAAAKSYLESPAQQKMIDAMFSPDQMVAMLKAQMPTVSQDKLDAVAKIVSEELNSIRPKMEEVMLEAAVEQFTTEELEAMDEFYRSEMGEAVMLKMPGFMQSYTSQMGEDMGQMQQRIMQRVMQEMSKQ